MIRPALTPASAATARSGADMPSTAKRWTAACRIRARPVSSRGPGACEPASRPTELTFNRLYACSVDVEGCSQPSTQRGDGLQRGGLERRVGAGQQPDDPAQGGRPTDQPEVEDRRPLLGGTDKIGRASCRERRPFYDSGVARKNQ